MTKGNKFQFEIVGGGIRLAGFEIGRFFDALVNLKEVCYFGLCCTVSYLLVKQTVTKAGLDTFVDHWIVFLQLVGEWSDTKEWQNRSLVPLTNFQIKSLDLL